MALPCASAKPSRLLPEVFDDCSLFGRMLSPRDWAIIRELNESVFAFEFLETGCIGHSESTEKVGPGVSSTSLSPFRDFGLQTTKCY